MALKKPKLKDHWTMGTAIGLGAAIGITLGALFNDPSRWLSIGAGLDVVLGAVTGTKKQ